MKKKVIDGINSSSIYCNVSNKDQGLKLKLETLSVWEI